jgi:endonuclease/exonuclease/phosphatase family metal-dependent hydrolase
MSGQAGRMQTKSPSLRASIIASLRERRRTKHSATGARQEGTLVASYNVHKCVGVDGKFDPGRIARVIAEIEPDIIALQEADKRFGERHGLLDLDWLERETGLLPVPLSTRGVSHGWHGNLVLFRQGLVREVHQVALPGLEPRGALVVDLDLEDGTPLRLVAAHFGLLRRSRSQQARMILETMRAREERLTLLMGDLNEWRLGKRSALEELGPAFGTLPLPVPSFPSGMPLLALDRIIANRPEVLSPVEVHDTALARAASDHLPIKAFIDTAQALRRLAEEAVLADGGPPSSAAAAEPLPLAGLMAGEARDKRNGELVRKAGARLKRAVGRTLGRRGEPRR